MKKTYFIMLAGILLCSACGTKQEAPAAASIAPVITAAPQTAEPAEQERKQADYFSRGTVEIFAGDYILDAPSAWQLNNGFMFAENDPENNAFAVMDMTTHSESEPFTDEELVSLRQEYIDSLMESEQLVDPTLEKQDTVTINDVTVNRAWIKAGLKNGEESIPGIYNVAWFLDPATHTPITLYMFVSDESTFLYDNDFEAVLNTIGLKRKEALSIEDFTEAVRQQLPREEGTEYNVYARDNEVIIRVLKKGMAAHAQKVSENGEDEEWRAMRETMRGYSQTCRSSLDQYNFADYACTVYVVNEENTEEYFLRFTDGEEVED